MISEIMQHLPGFTQKYVILRHNLVCMALPGPKRPMQTMLQSQQTSMDHFTEEQHFGYY